MKSLVTVQLVGRLPMDRERNINHYYASKILVRRYSGAVLYVTTKVAIPRSLSVISFSKTRFSTVLGRPGLKTLCY